MKKLILLAALLLPQIASARPAPSTFDNLHVTMTGRVLDPDAGLCSTANPSALAAAGIALILATRRRRS